MPNRLKDETSPYLLQHADNPVDWFPWGEEAFEAARTQDKPVLLSVGYSACHWCHVMAHESFEDPAIAGLMNEHFINIKVDREERPDIDGVYMTAVQALTGQGGWPMTVFMTPDGKPFYAGTYFPPSDGHGRPGFPRVLETLHQKWIEEKDQVVKSAEAITGHIRLAAARVASGEVDLSNDLPARAAALYGDVFDAEWGGFGMAPKFPSPSGLEFLLAHSLAPEADPAAREMVLHTLRQMASGGMYDQLGGGFARYSVDERWMVPHFEKMLYDNAQLVRVYLHAFQLTGEPLFERIVRETLAYLEREMLDPEGGFYAAQDADSEGIEGKYFVWTVDELAEVLGEDGPLAAAWYGVTAGGNFIDPHHPELVGRNVLSVRQDADAVAARFGLAVPALLEKVEWLRTTLLAARSRRVKPGLDDKMLTSWNGLALAAFAEAARVLQDPSYRDVSEHNAQFLRDKVWRKGRLLHTYKAGVAKVEGVLEDYAYVGLGLVELFKLTGELAHLDWARELFETALREFRDSGQGGFFDTSASGEALIVRQKSFFDAATPSGNGAMALLALWIARYYVRPEGEHVTREVLNQVHDHLLQAPTGFGSLWQAVEFLLAPHREVAIVGEPAARQPLEAEVSRAFRPWMAVAPSANGGGLPMFEGRGATGSAMAYVCEDMVCQLPVATASELAEQLKR